MRQLSLLIIGLCLSSGAGAATLADAQVGFSAERTLVLDSHTYDGKIWAMPGEERHEQVIQAFRPIFLLHAGNPLGKVVLPELKTVVEFVIPPEFRLFDHLDVKKHAVGEDPVDGVATTEYAIDESVPEGHAEGTLWLSRDGIPMRFDGTFIGRKGKPTKVHWQLEHLKIGPQPAALFDPPHGYTVLPAEAVAPLLGLRLKSAKH